MSSDFVPGVGAGGIIHKVCSDFCRNEIEPLALEIDAHGVPGRMGGVWVKSMELEIPSMLVPEEYGGVGHDLLTAAQVLEELAMGCAGIAAGFAFHLAACIPLIEAGDSQGELLSRIGNDRGDEPIMLTFALPPGEGGRGGPSIVSVDGAPVLSGTAALVGCASLADRVLVFAPDEDAAGLSLAAVDMRAKGVSLDNPASLPGLHAVPFSDVVFKGCRVGEGSIVGARGKAAHLMEQMLGTFNGFVAAIAMGAARNAYTRADAYARERYQFGKFIIEHQRIRRYLAAMLVKMEMGRAGYMKALAAERAGRTDIAKIFCTNAALEIAQDAIQVHGGIGYMKETGLEKIMRDAKMLQLLGKSNPCMELELVD